MAFEVELSDNNITEMLKDMQKRVDDFKNMRKGLTGLLSANVYKDIIEHFEKEQGSEGKWKKWSRLYDIAMKKRGKGSNKILQDSGRLRNTFKPTSHRVMANGILWYNNAKTKDGAPYAYYHDEGKGQPKRDFMWLSDKTVSKLESELLQYILENTST